MTDEPQMPHGGWTPSTLKVFTCWALERQWEHTEDRLEAIEKTAITADKLATTRSEQQNEWRATVNDISGRMMTRTEYEAKHETLCFQVMDSKERLDRLEGRSSGVSGTMAAVLAGWGVISTIVVIVLSVVRL